MYLHPAVYAQPALLCSDTCFASHYQRKSGHDATYSLQVVIWPTHAKQNTCLQGCKRPYTAIGKSHSVQKCTLDPGGRRSTSPRRLHSACVPTRASLAVHPDRRNLPTLPWAIAGLIAFQPFVFYVLKDRLQICSAVTQFVKCEFALIIPFVAPFIHLHTARRLPCPFPCVCWAIS